MSHLEQVQVQRPCPNCGGGALGIVTQEMATDAGMPEIVGQPVPCDTCGGYGSVEDVDVIEVEDDDQ